jgi:hypothetical protein
MSKQAHHIVPDYRCKELGITTSYKVKISGKLVEFYFKENYLPGVEQIDHALIHWGYLNNDLEPLFKYVTPPQWVIDLIPRGDKRDMWAAQVNGLGAIDGIDMSGENSPNYKNGNWIAKDHEQDLQNHRDYRKTPQRKAYKRKWDLDNFEKEAKRLRNFHLKKKEEKLAETQGVGTLVAHMSNADDFTHDIPEYPINTHVEKG